MMILQATISVSIATIFGSIFSLGLILIGIFARRAINMRDKRLETMETKISENKKNIAEHLTNEKVAQQSFEDYKKYKEEKDGNFEKLVYGLGEKIDGLVSGISDFKQEIKDEIHDLELKFTKSK